MKKTDVRALLVKADGHYIHGRWDDALSCFDAVLAAEPNNRYALEGRRKTLVQRDAEAQIVAQIDEARAALEAGRFEAAQMRLDHAQALGADRRILNHHAEIFALRDRAWEYQRWQNRIASDLKRARSLETRRALKEAIAVLEELLRDLTAAGIEGLGQAARLEWDRLRGEGDLEDRLEDIDRAFEAENFKFACELVEHLASERPSERRIERKRTAILGAWQMFQRQLSHAEAAVAEGRLDDACGVLGNLRQIAPKNPEWQALWQRVYLGRGQGLVSAGQQAVQTHAFEDAQAAFGAAVADFGEVLVVFPAHASAGLAQAEAKALAETARWLAQAVRDRAARRWEPAREALRGAREQLAAASGVRRQDFGDVRAVVDSLAAEVKTALDELRQARALLDEGAVELASRAPDRAECRYREGLGLAEGRDEDLKANLLAGLQEATSVQREVTALLGQAARSTDAAEALGPLQQAHERWPDAPGLVGRLVETLLAAAEAALAGGDEDRAAAWSEQVLALAGVSEGAWARAQAIAGGVGCKKQVAAALAEARRLHGELVGVDLATAVDCDRLVKGYERVAATLARAQEYAQGCPDLRPEIAPLAAQTQERLARLQQAQPQLAEAETWAKRGDWPKAVDALGAAADTLSAELAGRGVRQREQAYREVAAAVTAGLDKARGELGQAQRAYEVAGSGKLIAVRWHELDAALDAAEAALATRPAGADPLPAAWAKLQDQVQDLRARAGVLRKAWENLQAGRPMPALTGLVAAAGQRPDDPVLAAVRGWLRKETADRGQAQAQRLLGEARALAEQSELTEAIERLAQARELDVESADVTAELARLDRQLKLLERLKRSAVVGQTKRASNSPAEALDAFREVLQTAQDADSGLADEVRAQLAALLTLERRLHQEEIWDKADGLVTALGQAGAGNRILANHVLASMRAWFELATNKAREGFISSLHNLGQYMEAYAAAKQACAVNPNNERLIQLAAESRTAIQMQLLGSTQKRLGRAMELSEKGYFAEALTELDGIEDQFMQRVRAEGRDLLHDFDALSSVLEEARDLQKKLLRLRERGERLTSLFSQARQLYARGTEAALREAERLLDEVEWMDREHAIELLWNDLNRLRDMIARRLQQVVRERLQDTTTHIEAELETLTSMEGVQQLWAETARLHADLQDLPPAESTSLSVRTSKIIHDLQERLAQLQQIAMEEERARYAESRGELPASLEAYERAAGIACGPERIRLGSEVSRLRSEVQRQADMQQAWERTIRAYKQGDYETARRCADDAVRLGKSEAEVALYDRAIETGLLIQKATAMQKHDLVEARDLLKQAISLVSDLPFALHLRDEARQLLATIESDVLALLLGVTKRFFAQVGFNVEVLNERSVMCASELVRWKKVSPLYVQLMLDRKLGASTAMDLCMDAETRFGGDVRNHVMLVVLDQQPTPGELHQIISLRQNEKLTVVPITRADLQLRQREQSDDEWLLDQIGIFAGEVPLLARIEDSSPVVDALSFFGRTQTLVELEQLLYSGIPAIVFGLRRIGKTSLLHRLQTQLQWPTALIDLENDAGMIAPAFSKALAAWRSAIAGRYGRFGHRSDDESDLSPYRFREQVIAILEATRNLPGSPGLVLMLDEAEYLVQAPEGLQFARILRGFNQDPDLRSRFSLLVASKSPRLINRTGIIHAQDNPFFKFFTEKPLGGLDVEATTTMIESFGMYMGIGFAPDVLSDFARLVGGLPYLTRELYAHMVRRLEHQTHVDSKHMAATVKSYVTQPGSYLEKGLWATPSRTEADLLFLLARATKPCPEDELLTTAPTGQKPEGRRQALGRLLDLGLVQNKGDDWEITVPLYRAWIRRNKLSMSDWAIG